MFEFIRTFYSHPNIQIRLFGWFYFGVVHAASKNNKRTILFISHICQIKSRLFHPEFVTPLVICCKADWKAFDHLFLPCWDETKPIRRKDQFSHSIVTTNHHLTLVHIFCRRQAKTFLRYMNYPPASVNDTDNSGSIGRSIRFWRIVNPQAVLVSTTSIRSTPAGTCCTVTSTAAVISNIAEDTNVSATITPGSPIDGRYGLFAGIKKHILSREKRRPLKNPVRRDIP